jgi:N-acetylmuramoyl-L-alanine amidase
MQLSACLQKARLSGLKQARQSRSGRQQIRWFHSRSSGRSRCIKARTTGLRKAANRATGLPLREVNGESVINKTDETFLNDTTAPVFTLFLGHISNSTDDKKINDADFQTTMAQAIVNGILKYLGVNQ